MCKHEWDNVFPSIINEAFFFFFTKLYSTYIFQFPFQLTIFLTSSASGSKSFAFLVLVDTPSNFMLLSMSITYTAHVLKRVSQPS